MNLRASAYKKTFSLLLALAFLSATGPDVYGVHDCPYHGHSEAAAASSDGEHGDTSGEHHSPESDQPCTWLVDCHASVESSLYVSPAKSYVSAPIVERSTSVPSEESVVWGPRHLLYELHLPNAPPARA